MIIDTYRNEMDNFKSLLFLISVNIVLAINTTDQIYCTEKFQTANCRASIPLYVNNSYDRNELNSPILYDDIDFCKGNETGDNSSLPLPLDIKFLKPQKCIGLCTKTYIGGNEDDDMKLEIIKDAILAKYQHRWFVNAGNIPVQWCWIKDDKMVCEDAFPMGCYFDKKYNNSNLCNINELKDDKGYYLYNHVNLKITFRSKEKITSGFAIDGITGSIKHIKVTPTSVRHQTLNEFDCKDDEPMFLPEGRIPNGELLKITYSYSVQYELDNYTPPTSATIEERSNLNGDESSGATKINLTFTAFLVILLFISNT